MARLNYYFRSPIFKQFGLIEINDVNERIEVINSEKYHLSVSLITNS